MSYDIINYLRKVNAEQALIDKLITNLQQRQPQIKGDVKTVKKIIAGNVRKRTLTSVIGSYGLNPTYVRGLEQDRYMKKITGVVKSYPLVHTVTGAEILETIANAKFGCGGINDGTKYITTTHNAMLDMGTGSFSLSCWYKSTNGNTHAIACKKDVTAATNAGFDFYVSNTQHVVCSIGDGTNSSTLDKDATGIKDGAWHSIVVNIPNSGNLEAFVDNISIGTQARGSVANINNSRDMYEMARDSGGSLVNKFNGSIALFSLVLNTLDSSARTDFSNAIINTTNEGIFRPYCANWNAEPNMTSGLFQSGS